MNYTYFKNQLFIALAGFLFFGQNLLAQEETPDMNLDVNVKTTETSEVWYTNPLYIIIGVLLLIILIAVVAISGKK